MGYTEAVKFGFIYGLPLLQIALILLVLFVIAEEIGFRMGLRYRQLSGVRDAESGGGGPVQTSRFAVLGLILAFTYLAAVDRHEDRRRAIVQEANALGTAYLRADVIDEPLRSELKQALYDYAATRLPERGGMTDERRIEALRISLQAQSKIWPLTRRAVEQEERQPIAFGLLASINEILEAHTNRLDAITHKLPAPAIYFLIIISLVSLAINGFSTGVQGHFSRWRSYGFASILAGFILLIMDFDRPSEGLIKQRRLSLESTVADMRADLSQQSSKATLLAP